MSNHPVGLMILGRVLSRRLFTKKRAAEDPMGLEAYKLAIGRGEIELGLLISRKFSLSFILCTRRPVALCLMKLALSSSKGLIGLIVYIAWYGRFLLALIPVTCLLMKDLAIYGKPSCKHVDLGGEVFGFYPEVSGRTRTLFEALKNFDAQLPHKVIVLGRPKMSLGKAAEVIRDQLNGRAVEAFYPLCWSCWWSILPHFPRAMHRLIGRSIESNYFPTFAESIRSTYRLFTGLLAERWSNSVNVKSNTRLWMCHTGLLDTSFLEIGLQGRGVKTIHWVHGISEGVNFSGLSTYAVFRCGYDVKWHSNMGGYGFCVPGSGKKIELRTPPQKQDAFLLMTNYAHLMNYGYQVNGIEDECAALRVFSEAAKSISGIGSLKMLWKPHPIFDRLPIKQRQMLNSLAEELGFIKVDSGVTLDDLLAQSKYIACTQSTIALDILVEGHLPVLLCIQGTDPDYSLSQLILKAESSEGLSLAWSRLNDHHSELEIFKESLARIEPVSYPTLKQFIEQLD